MLTREQRLKEREVKRILHEEELARLEEMKANGEDPDSRRSDRQLLTELERKKKELAELKEEEERWIFDCAVCGMHGENIDDGTHSIACERCSIWQHSKCHGIQEIEAERDDFHFLCADCKRKDEDAKKPKIPPLKLGRVEPSSSPQPAPSDGRSTGDAISGVDATPRGGRVVEGVSVYKRPSSVTASPSAQRHAHIMDGPSLSPQGLSPGPPGYRHTGPSPVGVPQPVWQGTPLPPPQRPNLGALNTHHNHSHGTNGQPASPSYQLHQQAHASAVATSSLPHSAPYANGHSNGSMPPPFPSQTHQRPVSQHGLLGAQRPFSSHSLNGTFSSPTKARQSMSPLQADPHTMHHSPNAQPRPFSLSHSPHTSFPPPQQQYYQQQAAGHSPVKQLSSSPQQPYPHNPYSQSPGPYPVAATPLTHAAAPAATPMSSLLRPSPGMTSSPIPPVGSGPVIPQKHDTPRPVSHDSVGETPVFPPALALSPTATDGGKGMGMESGQGGLGTGTVPVKRMPEQSPQQAQAQAQALDALMKDA